MKKLILLLFISVLWLGCKKDKTEPRVCWNCVMTYQGSNLPSEEICDKTETEIRQVEQDGNSTYPNGDLVVSCSKK